MCAPGHVEILTPKTQIQTKKRVVDEVCLGTDGLPLHSSCLRPSFLLVQQRYARKAREERDLS